MVVLHEALVAAGGLAERALVEALHEEATLVTEHLWFEDEHFGDRCLDRIHQNTRSFSTLSRYCP